MNELVSRLVANHGIDENTAQRAVEIIIGFLRDAGPPDKVNELMARMPDSDKVETPEAGTFAGMMGAMGAFNALNSAGLGMGDIQNVTKDVVAYAKEKAGPDLVDEVTSSIPGLNQFV